MLKEETTVAAGGASKSARDPATQRPKAPTARVTALAQWKPEAPSPHASLFANRHAEACAMHSVLYVASAALPRNHDTSLQAATLFRAQPLHPKLVLLLLLLQNLRRTISDACALPTSLPLHRRIRLLLSLHEVTIARGWFPAATTQWRLIRHCGTAKSRPLSVSSTLMKTFHNPQTTKSAQMAICQLCRHSTIQTARPYGRCWSLTILDEM